MSPLSVFPPSLYAEYAREASAAGFHHHAASLLLTASNVEEDPAVARAYFQRANIERAMAYGIIFSEPYGILFGKPAVQS